MAIQESYVKVKEQVIKTPSAGNVSNSSNIAGVIVAPTGPKLAYITSPAEFLKTYTKDGETIPRNADITFVNAYYLSYSSGLVLARATNTNAVGGVAVTKDWKLVPIIFKDGKVMRYKYTFKVTLLDKKDSSWSLRIGDYAFYQGNVTEITEDVELVQVDSFTEIPSALENIGDFGVSYTLTEIEANANDSTDNGKLVLELNLFSNENETLVTKTYDNSLKVTALVEEVETEVTSVDAVVYNPADVYNIPESTEQDPNPQPISSDPEDLNEDNWIFTVKNELPESTNEDEIKIDPFDGKSFLLTLGKNKADEGTEQYRVSLDPEATDDNKINIYIEYLNTQNIGYEVTVYNTIDEVHDSIINYEGAGTNIQRFGKSGYNDKESKSDTNLCAALEYVADQEIYDVEYLAPMGITSGPFVTRLQYISNRKKWFCPLDVPYDYTTYTSVKNYSNNVNPNNSDSPIPGSILLGPFDKNSSLTGWVNYIGASTLYLERVMANKSNNAEFAPVFKPSYGTLSYSNPTKLFLKSEREKLLSLGLPVNWAVYDQRTLSYYMNDNRTRTNDQTSVVCEEQNSRIVWKISKDIDRLLDQFISQYNTKATRARVVDVLNYYFTWNIMNQQFPPDAYEVICDETINTPEVINANKLAVIVKVRLYKAIKYIEVVNKVYPLGVDFNQSI